MAFKATNYTLARGYDSLKAIAARLKKFAQQASTKMQAGDVDSNYLFAIVDELLADKAQMTEYSQLPGMAQYARDQEDDQTYDVVAEYNAMIAAINAAGIWIRDNFPKDVDDYLLERKFNLNVTTAPRIFTPAELTGLVTLIDAVDAAIE